VTTPVLSLFAYMTKSSYKGTAGKTYTVPYVATSKATVKLQVKRGSKVVTTVTGKSKKGRNKLKISRKKLKKSGRYKLTLTATGSDGQKATDKGKLTLAKKRRR
jgi:methionine-rich copper-binding protein CopC